MNGAESLRVTLSVDKDVWEQATDPQWDHAGRVHDWRNYIPDELREIWDDLCWETKIVAAVIANIQAELEEWD